MTDRFPQELQLQWVADRMHWIKVQAQTELGSRGLLFGATEDSAGPGPDCIAVRQEPETAGGRLSQKDPVMAYVLIYFQYSYCIIIM